MFTAALVALMLVGVVVLQAMVAQTSFHATQLDQQIQTLATRYQALSGEAASLSAPSAVAKWATSHGMVPADASHSVIVHVAGRGATSRTAAMLGRDAALVKGVLGSSG